MQAPPDFLSESPRLLAAFDFARHAHEGPAARDDTPLHHPVEVTRILHDHGCGEDVLAAALLHDVVEDSACDQTDIAPRFGSRVARLVATMTEDASIESFDERKADHRHRVGSGGSEVAMIFAADKLAKVCELARRRETVEPEKLKHYELCLEMLRGCHPEVGFLDELGAELAAYRRALPAGVR